MENLHPSVLSAIVAGLVAIVWFFLRKKDVDQEKAIELLFKKHDQDAKDLQEFKLQMAHNHYPKPELDVKFQKIEEAIEKGMDRLGDKFDHLAKALVDHISKEDARK